MTERDERQATQNAFTRTLAVIGLGFALSLLAGLLIGWLTGDLAGGLGRTVAIGMGITAALAIGVNFLPNRH
jgi:hypothetical protein